MTSLNSVASDGYPKNSFRHLSVLSGLLIFSSKINSCKTYYFLAFERSLNPKPNYENLLKQPLECS